MSRPGTANCCPTCQRADVISATVPPELAAIAKGYGPTLALCKACRIMWEPIDEALLWDPDDPLCSFSEPCDNCAFRPGSPEQADKEKWRAMLDQLKAGMTRGGAFYCHKGVPIEAESEHGVAYPPDESGKPITKELRVCRGFLNAWGAWMDKEMEKQP